MAAGDTILTSTPTCRTVERSGYFQTLEDLAGTAVVVLTRGHDPAFMHQVYDAGASAYVLKEAAAKELVGAIWAAAERAARELPPGRRPRADR